MKLKPEQPTLNRPGKPRVKSKTHWFNVSALLFSAAAVNLPALEGVVGREFYQVALFVIPAVNMVLRELTKEPIAR